MTTSLKGEVTVREPTRAQQAIARRVAEAKATVPDITVDIELEMDRVLELRRELAREEDPAPEDRDFVLKACGLALREFPAVNASYRDGRFELYSRINIGITVAGDGYLSVPTILDADRRTLREIATESRALTGRVMDGAISSAELAGATFTISDLGAHPVARFQPIIAPPQAAALGLGALRSIVLLNDGAAQERRVLTASMTCDHRILYGADAGAFLARLRELLAAPDGWAGE
jgi:pyruvate dehydrogenase E2 component (dihydrolipoamide acetyltransferase)